MNPRNKHTVERLKQNACFIIPATQVIETYQDWYFHRQILLMYLEGPGPNDDSLIAAIELQHTKNNNEQNIFCQFI